MSEDKQVPFEMINGTQCYACYAVFGENTTDKGVFKIGIKPLTSFSHQASFFGFRIRAVPVADADFTGGEAIKEAFPGLPFSKLDKERASLVGGAYVNRGTKQADEIQPWLESHGVMRQAINAIEQALQGVPFQHKEAIRDWMWQYYLDKLSQVKPPPVDESPMVSPVVSLEEHKAKKAFKEQLPDKMTPSEHAEWSGDEIDGSPDDPSEVDEYDEQY